jgi:hypothetical protein
METIFDLLKKEPRVSDVFQNLAEAQIETLNESVNVEYPVCEQCYKTSDKCLCDEFDLNLIL